MYLSVEIIVTMVRSPFRRVLMGTPNYQLTTNFSANCQLITTFLANCQLTTNFSYLFNFYYLTAIIIDS